jgi:tetratricopeptide (TPR) repeat protein
MNRPSLLTLIILLTALTLTGCGTPVSAPSPPPSPSLLSQGERLLAQRDFAGALAQFEKVLEADKDNPAALAGKGAALNELGRRDEAMAVLDRLLTKAPSDPRGLLCRAGVFRDAGRMDRALEDYRKAAEDNPGDAWANLEYGRFLAYIRKDVDAITYLTRALELGLEPGDGAACLMARAYAHSLAGDEKSKESDLDRAEEHLNRALNGENTLFVKASLLISRAYIHKHRGRAAQAEKDLQEALKTGQKEAECLFFLSGIYLDMNEEDKALKMAERYRAIDPDFKKISYLGIEMVANYYRNMGSLLADRGEAGRAIENYDHAVRLEPDNLEGLRERATLLFMEGNVEKARADAKKWLSLAPPAKGGEDLIARARALTIAGEGRKAKACLDEGIRKEPGNYALYLERSIAGIVAGDVKGAEVDFEKFRRLAPPGEVEKAGAVLKLLKKPR